MQGSSGTERVRVQEPVQGGVQEQGRGRVRTHSLSDRGRPVQTGKRATEKKHEQEGQRAEGEDGDRKGREKTRERDSTGVPLGGLAGLHRPLRNEPRHTLDTLWAH